MKLQICLIPRTQSWLPRIISNGNREPNSNNVSPSILLANGVSASPSSLVVSGCYRKFLHIVSPDIGLEELCNEITGKHARLYPGDPPLKIERLQDFNECDLDLGYSVGEVFDDSNIVRVIVDPESMPFRRKRKVADSPYETLMASNEYAKRQAFSKDRLPNGSIQRESYIDDSSQPGLFDSTRESARKVRYGSVTLTPPSTMLSNAEFLKRIREQGTDFPADNITPDNDVRDQAPLEIAESIMDDVVADNVSRNDGEDSLSPVVRAPLFTATSKLSNAALAEIALERLRKQSNVEKYGSAKNEQVISPGSDLTKEHVTASLHKSSSSDKEKASSEGSDESNTSDLDSDKEASPRDSSANEKVAHSPLSRKENVSEISGPEPEQITVSSGDSKLAANTGSQQQRLDEDLEPATHSSENYKVAASEDHTDKAEVQMPASPETENVEEHNRNLKGNRDDSIEEIQESLVEDYAPYSGNSLTQTHNPREPEAALSRYEKDDTLSPSVSQSLDEPSVPIEKTNHEQNATSNKAEVPTSRPTSEDEYHSKTGPAGDLEVQESVNSSKEPFVSSLDLEDSNTKVSSKESDTSEEESEDKESEEEEDNDDESDDSMGSPPPSRRPRAVFSSTDEIMITKAKEPSEERQIQSSAPSSVPEPNASSRSEIFEENIIHGSQQKHNTSENSSQSIRPPSISSSQIPSSFNESHEKVASPRLPNPPSMAARSFKTLKDLVRRGVPEVHDAHSSKEKQLNQRSRNKLSPTKGLNSEESSDSESESDDSSSSSSSDSSDSDLDDNMNGKHKTQNSSQQSHIPPEKRAGSSQTSTQRPRRNNALRALFKR